MLNTAYDDDQRPVRPELARVAAHADTGLFFACPDPETAYTHLLSRGVAAERPRVSFQWPAA